MGAMNGSVFRRRITAIKLRCKTITAKITAKILRSASDRELINIVEDVINVLGSRRTSNVDQALRLQVVAEEAVRVARLQLTAIMDLAT